MTDISGILRLSPLTAPLALASSSTLFSSGRTGTRSSRSLAAKVGGQEPQKSAWRKCGAETALLGIQVLEARFWPIFRIKASE